MTCLLEMCFGGVAGVTVDVQHRTRGLDSPVHVLFAEELGWLLEVERTDKLYVQSIFRQNNVPCLYLGDTTAFGMDARVSI